MTETPDPLGLKDYLATSASQPGEVHNHLEITRNFELYDTEVLAMEKVVERIRLRLQSRVDRSAIGREVRERFNDIGLVVNVSWGIPVDQVENFKFKPDECVPVLMVDLIGRTHKLEWDPNQQVHQVTNDVLDLGDGGVIKTPTEVIEGGGHQH